MSAPGWYDSEGNFHEGAPPQPKQAEPVQATPEPAEPAGWYDAEGEYHEGLPPGLAAKRAAEEAAKQAAAQPKGWYDAEGEYHEGTPPGLAAKQQATGPAPTVAAAPAAVQAESAAAAPSVQVVVEQAPAAPKETPVVAAAAPKKRGGLVAGAILVWTAFVASLAAFALVFFGMFSLASLGLGAAGAAANGASAAQLALVPANQAGYTSWRTEAMNEVNATPPEVLAKALAGEAPDEAVAASIAEVSGDRGDSYGATVQVCQFTSLRTLFESDAARGEAWVAAMNSDETLGWGGGELKLADLKAYTDNLTPVVLLADTAVTAHGYVTGASFPVQSVLQAGTLVGIDRYGVPRVRCASGEPLSLAAQPEGGSAQFTGQQWQGFDAAKIVRVAPAASAVGGFDVRFVGAANVEGGSIAPGWMLCDRDSCPAPGPDAKAPENPTIAPAGTVSAGSPAGCTPLNDAKKHTYKIYNLSDKPIVLSWVDPVTCQTVEGNSDWNAILGPGQVFQNEVSEGQIIQFGNGTDAGVIDSMTVTESMVFGVG